MTIKNIALINANDQVVNIVIVDVEDETTMSGLHEQWGTIRWAEFDHDTDNIVLDPNPEIWTTHTDSDGFIAPAIDSSDTDIVEDFIEIEEVTINGRVYPRASLLIVENADNRPAGWVLPDGELEVSLSNAD
jgi:hypothetical protein